MTEEAPQSAHGLSLLQRLRVLNESWCPTCPANAGDRCTFVETDRSAFKKGWPINVGDPIPYMHYRRKQKWYLYLGERPVEAEVDR